MKKVLLFLFILIIILIFCIIALINKELNKNKNSLNLKNKVEKQVSFDKQNIKKTNKTLFKQEDVEFGEIQYNKSEKANESEKNNFIEEKINIKINMPVPLSYKTKKDVYKIRKYYVSKSIFARPDYEPSEVVFGRIEDGKPWISVNMCQKYDQSIVEGPSEESRFINNPSILVGVNWPYSYNTKDTEAEYCKDIDMPKSATYNKSKNEIEVVYKIKENYKKNPYQLEGTNARDLGYEYAYVDLTKSTNPIEFTESENITNQIIQFRNFIHTGGSCGVPGGCNNGSPNQRKLKFKYFNKEGKDSVTYIKLWKNRPSSPEEKPDIVEKIIIKPF